MIVVSDTSCISNLLLINQLELLQKIYKDIYIPPAVYKEILMLEEDGIDLSYFKSREWIFVENNFTKNISLSPPKYIEKGEAQAISIWLFMLKQTGF